MKHVPHMLLALALLLLTATAEAQGNDRSGWAVNAGIGGSIIRDEDGSETFRGSAFAYKLGVEYRTRGILALGFSVFDLGTANDTIGGVDTDIDVDGFDFHARFILNGGDQTEFYGFLGGALYDADVSTGGAFNLFGEDAWEIGGGIDFHTGDQGAIRLELRFLNGPRDESGGLATVGFNFRF